MADEMAVLNYKSISKTPGQLYEGLESSRRAPNLASSHFPPQIDALDKHKLLNQELQRDMEL